MSFSKVFKKILLSTAVLLVVAAIGFTFWVRDRYVVPILMYHQVGVPSSDEWRLNTVSEEAFDYQMNFIKRNGFHVISFDDLVEGIKKGHQFSRNTVVIQFDDGYANNYTAAFPILKKYGFPAMVFLVSDLVGTPGFVTWEQVKEMEKDNFLAGSHTCRHAYLPEVSPEEAREEIFNSKKAIEEKLGHPIDYFAYPVGGFTAQAKKLVEEAGYKAAVTTNRGVDRFNVDLYELKRIRVNNTDNRFAGLILWCKLSGYYNLFRKFKEN